MKPTLFLLLLAFGLSATAGQRYLVFFGDKGTEVSRYYQDPTLLLSDKAWEKRKARGILIDYNDLPVAEAYTGILSKNGVRVLSSSRWLNAALVETELTESALKQLTPAIVKIQSIPAGAAAHKDKLLSEAPGGHPSAKTTSVIDYGLAVDQDTLIGIDYLHDLGYRGEGITIAFLDAGFPGLDTVSFFDSLYYYNRVVGTRDFWTGNAFVHHKLNHGTLCASIALENTPGQFVGTAPDASAIFAITDDSTETHQDEFYYVAALEWADSLGADVISASISYKGFDSGQGDYTYADMDGHTAITTTGCNIAAAHGLLIVNAAGNSGTICAPCDADSILCVGGADIFRNYDGFSSFGPSYDGRVKPDVAAKTINAFFVSPGDWVFSLFYGGTSSATPMIAGLAGCLMQAHPSATNIQVINAIRQSAHHHNAPDSLMGYGVPNARRADSILASVVTGAPVNTKPSGKTLRSFPNPVFNRLYLADNSLIETAKVYDLQGRLVSSGDIHSVEGSLDVSPLPPGLYLLKAVYTNGNTGSLKFIKQ